MDDFLSFVNSLGATVNVTVEYGPEIDVSAFGEVSKTYLSGKKEWHAEWSGDGYRGTSTSDSREELMALVISGILNALEMKR